MSKRMKTVLVIITSLGVLLLMAFLVWGQTWRMARANRLYQETNFEEAGTIYEDMAVDLPDSPQVRHNLGLFYHEQKDHSRAEEEWKQVLSKLETDKELNGAEKELLFKLHYHMGNNKFAQAEEARKQSGQVSPYWDAMLAYKKAIETNRNDEDAKYNFELALLRQRIGTPNPEASPRPDESDKPKPTPGPDYSPQPTPGEDKNQPQPSPGQDDKQQSEPSPGKEQNQGSSPEEQQNLSREEAEALLEMAEQGEQYQGILVPHQGPVGKDW